LSGLGLLVPLTHEDTAASLTSSSGLPARPLPLGPSTHQPRRQPAPVIVLVGLGLPLAAGLVFGVWS